MSLIDFSPALRQADSDIKQQAASMAGDPKAMVDSVAGLQLQEKANNYSIAVSTQSGILKMIRDLAMKILSNIS